MNRTGRLAIRLLMVCGAVAIGVSILMMKTSLYVPEAAAPTGFPRPGKVNQIVLKSYPAYRSAIVRQSGDKQNRMFGQLFDHIKTNDIAMTAPVEMTFDDSGTDSMAFIYSGPDVGHAGPDGPVEVVDHPAMDVVSIAIRGAYNQQRFDDNCAKLRQWLTSQDAWEASGPPRYLAFNSPFVPPFFRFGEVQIPVRVRSVP